MSDWEAQQYVTRGLNDLEGEEKGNLQREKESIDIERVYNIFKQCTAEPVKDASQFEPLGTVLKVTSQEQHQSWEKEGLTQIRNNKVAVVLLAGGQGSRLGYNHPKGMYDFGLPSHKSLFQIQAERIQNLQRRATPANQSAGVDVVRIPWYIMTSDATHDETVEFFNNNKFFGLDSSDVKFFQQSTLPATDDNGQILLSSPSSIFKAPDGNGGVYGALLNSGNLKDMEERGIETVFMYGVDNALVRVADPVFIGSFLESKTSCGSKSVPKACPEERVGILCKKNGIFQVIEYSEISEEMANQRNEDGSLTYNTGNIVTHIFTLDCLRDVCNRAGEIPYHLAKKEAQVYNPQSKSYEKSWVFKFEQFVFDSFQLVKDVFAFEVARSEEFTAIKNKEGKDCPATALQDLSNLHRSFLTSAGAIINGDGLVEISPLISYAGENLESYKAQTLTTPVLLE